MLWYPVQRQRLPSSAVADLLLGGVRVLREERDGRHHEAGRAVAALERVLLVEGLLDGMQLVVRGEALDRRHLACRRPARRAGCTTSPTRRRPAPCTRRRRTCRSRRSSPSARAARGGSTRAASAARRRPRGSSPLTVSEILVMPSPPASARHTFSPFAGISTWRTPYGASASITALWTAGVEPIVPDSPIPFAPSGFARRRRHHLDRLPRGELGRRRERVAEERARQRRPVLVVGEVLVERLRDAGRDAAVHLALGDERVDQRAGVVDRDHPQQLDLRRSRRRPRRRRRARRTGRSGRP